MEDISILVIKPEIIHKSSEVIGSLEKRGYKVVSITRKNNWRETIEHYNNGLTKEEIDCFISGYDRYNFGNEFLVLLIQHKDGNTLERMKKDKGHFKNYQENFDNTLRAEFGLSKEYNIVPTKNKEMTLVYCGIHSPESKEELDYQMNLFQLK